MLVSVSCEEVRGGTSGGLRTLVLIDDVADEATHSAFFETLTGKISI